MTDVFNIKIQYSHASNMRDEKTSFYLRLYYKMEGNAFKRTPSNFIAAKLLFISFAASIKDDI